MEFVRLFLEAGADKDLHNRHGDTVLMHAARTGQEEVVRLLVDAGAKKDLQNGDSYTAPMMAA